MTFLFNIAHDLDLSIITMWADFLLKATLLLSLTLCATRLFRNSSASVRYFMMTLLVGLIPVLLVMSFQRYPIRVATWDYPASIMTGSPVVSREVTAPILDSENITSVSEPVVNSGESPSWLDKLALESNDPKWQIRDWAGLLFVIWLLGVVIGMLGLLIRLVALWHYGRNLRPFPMGPITEALERTCQKLQIGETPRLLLSESHSLAMTWGIRRPMIVMPPEASEWSISQVESVFIHELAHILRRDFMLSIFHRICMNLLWFHPLAWWVNREVTLARESACDDVVISHVPARVFAQDLFSIAAGDRVEKVGLAMGMGLGRKSAVQQRIRALFGRAPHRVEVRLSERLMMIGGGALLLSSSVMTGCQATHSITMEGPPPGPRQMQFVATLNPRFSDTTVVSSSSPLPGERHLRFTINETSTLIKEGNREFLNTLPAPLPDLWSKPIAIRSGSSFNAKVKMTFSGHRILNAREAKEFLSMSGVMPSLYNSNESYDYKMIKSRARGLQSLQYYKPQVFQVINKPGKPFDPNEDIIKDPFPGEVDANNLGSYLNLSGRVLDDNATIELSFDIGYRLFDRFQVNEEGGKELPMYVESRYEAQVQLEDGGLVMFAGPLNEQWYKDHYPLIGGLFSRSHLEQFYRALVIQVEIID